MKSEITFAYEVLKKLEFSLPVSALNKPIDDGDYDMNKLLDAEGHQQLVAATERLMLSAQQNNIDLARVEGFTDVKEYYTLGNPEKVEPVEAMAYLVACAYAVGTQFKDGVLVSTPDAAVHPEQLSIEEKNLAVELARQVLGDTFPKFSLRDTSTPESMKPVINAARAVQKKEKMRLAKEKAKKERANKLVK